MSPVQNSYECVAFVLSVGGRLKWLDKYQNVVVILSTTDWQL